VENDSFVGRIADMNFVLRIGLALLSITITLALVNYFLNNPPKFGQ